MPKKVQTPCPIKIPRWIKKKWTEFQQQLFLWFADDLRKQREFLTHPKEPEITDRNRETIIHNAARLMVEHMTCVACDLYNLRHKTDKEQNIK
jgi:hypothetical protein